jgi:hypothetical protein
MKRTHKPADKSKNRPVDTKAVAIVAFLLARLIADRMPQAKAEELTGKIKFPPAKSEDSASYKYYLDTNKDGIVDRIMLR